MSNRMPWFELPFLIFPTISSLDAVAHTLLFLSIPLLMFLIVYLVGRRLRPVSVVLFLCVIAVAVCTDDTQSAGRFLPLALILCAASFVEAYWRGHKRWDYLAAGCTAVIVCAYWCVTLLFLAMASV